MPKTSHCGDILQLYPPTNQQHKLNGLYLSQNIRQHTGIDDVFIYSNFITSLDGRIALPVVGKRTRQVPAAIGNARDWRLFQELAAQADLLISSARYFRQADNREAQDNLPIGPTPEFDDLRAWRQQQGLNKQPDIAIFSASLDIPVTALQAYQHRKVIIFTGKNADPNKRDKLSSESHASIVICGDKRHVDGSKVRHCIKQLGYKFTYAIAGPSVLQSLVAGNALDRLYLTTAQKILGGEAFDTIAWGKALSPAPGFSLASLFLDPQAPEGASQMFAAYDLKQ